MDDHDLVEDGRIVKRRARGGEKGMGRGMIRTTLFEHRSIAQPTLESSDLLIVPSNQRGNTYSSAFMVLIWKDCVLGEGESTSSSVTAVTAVSSCQQSNNK